MGGGDERVERIKHVGAANRQGQRKSWQDDFRRQVNFYPYEGSTSQRQYPLREQVLDKIRARRNARGTRWVHQVYTTGQRYIKRALCRTGECELLHDVHR